ncbi:MAG: hypothetical protein O7G87_13420 [bacterium]|nr:hypothetical protein [bacterium]
MNSERNDREVPKGVLERYLLGELPEGELAQIRDVLAADGALRERLAALEQSNQEILVAYPADQMGRAISERLADEEAKVTQVYFPTGWAFAAAAVILLAAVLAWRPEPVRDMIAYLKTPSEQTPTRDAWDLDGLEVVRIKGATRLVLYRKTETGNELLHNGAVARQGDLIQILYHAAGQKYGAILSTDGRGSVTTHLPAVGTQAALLEDVKNEAVSLEFAYELDDAPHWERFYFITADSAFDLKPLLDEAYRVAKEGGDSLRVSESFKQFILTLKKEAM